MQARQGLCAGAQGSNGHCYYGRTAGGRMLGAVSGHGQERGDPDLQERAIKADELSRTVDTPIAELR